MAIPLDAPQDGLVASGDGRLLLVWTMGDAPTLSVIDVAARRRTREIPLPVRRVDGKGEPTLGMVRCIALDGGATTAWAASTEGQVFRIDLATGDLRTEVVATGPDDALYEFTDIVVDPDRDRILLATDGGEILALREGRTRRIARAGGGESIWRMKRRGAFLYFVAGPEGGVGFAAARIGGVSHLGTVDLSADRVVAETLLEEGLAEDLAVLDAGCVLVADAGMRGRILQFDAQWTLDVARGTRDFLPDRIMADGRRVLAGKRGTPLRPVYEYESAGACLSAFPTREYLLPEFPILDLAPLDEEWFAVLLQGREDVLLVPRSRSRPFGGFPDRDRQ